MEVKYTCTRTKLKVTEMQFVNTIATKARASPPSVCSEAERRMKYSYNQRKKMNKVIDMFNINFDVGQSCFVTLTFDSKVTDIAVASKFWKRFGKEMRRTYWNFMYIATVEFQGNGSIHYHMVCNIPTQAEAFNTISCKWKHGSVNVKETYDLDGLARYMTKDFMASDPNDCLFGKKRYLCSQNLQEPKILRSWKEDCTPDDLRDAEERCLQAQLERKHTIVNEHCGKITYTTYSANNSKLFKDFVYAEKRS